MPSPPGMVSAGGDGANAGMSKVDMPKCRLSYCQIHLVKRRFEAGGPNAARSTDIAYVKTRQGWLHPALVMDIWSRRIAGRSMGPGITAELADEALKMAVSRRNPPEGCLHHSDSKNVASRFCGNRNGAVSCSRDRIAAS